MTANDRQWSDSRKPMRYLSITVDGIRFRSHLEARWWIYLKHVSRIKPLYEAQGYLVKSGPYLLFHGGGSTHGASHDHRYVRSW